MCPATITTPTTPTHRAGSRVSAAMSTMHQPITQTTPAISYPAKSKLNGARVQSWAWQP
ncbi:MAG: hypothetical protein AB7L66_07150 [Gemmatimonadales bacterium]